MEFELYSAMRDVPFIYVTENFVRLSNETFKQLGKPQYARVLFADKGKRMALQPTVKSDRDAFKLVKQDNKSNPYMIITRRALVRKIRTVARCGKNCRFYGEYDTENDMIVFDLSNPVIKEQCEDKSKDSTS